MGSDSTQRGGEGFSLNVGSDSACLGVVIQNHLRVVIQHDSGAVIQHNSGGLNFIHIYELV